MKRQADKAPGPSDPLPALTAKLQQLEGEVRALSRRVAYLESTRADELRDRITFPVVHNGQQVVGKIPMWGTGRSIVVMKTSRGTFDLDVIDD
jgi:hypothetical protein